jgi:hypothetical protein
LRRIKSWKALRKIYCVMIHCQIGHNREYGSTDVWQLGFKVHVLSF